MQAILQVDQLSKTYRSGERALTVLKDISFAVSPGEKVAIVGPSGSGKTTLLGLCAGLDQATTGSVYLHGLRLDELDEDQRAAVRNQYVGFIFQNFQLIPTLTALENVTIPAELQGKRGVTQSAKALLEKVGLEDRIHHYPSQLSGGEQQRVALARAFSNSPRILFADEPTGNLDEETGQLVEELLFQLNAEMGTTLIIVTHDTTLAEKTDRIIQLKGGRVFRDTLATVVDSASQ
ncbi:MAG: ABC transporter ATP-binding protein [Bacteroidetes bacterium]|nr:MAG: ABC transporter ATP-binding protein [Bacteroidota bacterium]